MFVKSAALILLAAVALPLAPALAQDAPVSSLRALDYRYDAADALAAAQAEIAARLPVGTPIAVAQQVLHKVGVRCRDAQDGATMHCSYNSQQFGYDQIEDVAWTVDLASAQGVLISATVDRQPAGD